MAMIAIEVYGQITKEGLGVMFDEDLPKKNSSALDALIAEDLDPLSLEQLKSRISVLEAEIIRVQADMERKSTHMSAAEALFKK